MAQTTVNDIAAPGRTRGWRRADTMAVVVSAIGMVLLASVARTAFLRGDDWIVLSIVSRPDFGPLELLRPYGSHLMPFGLAAFWAMRAVFGPTPWWPLVGLGMSFVAVALTFTWLTIRALVGPRLQAVVPFAVAAWGPTALAAVMWPAPSVYMTPLWAATAAAVWAFVRGRFEPQSRRWHFLVFVIVALGLVAIETALLIVPLLFAISAGWFHTGGVRGAWRASKSLWLALCALAAVYVSLYFVLSTYVENLPDQRAGVDLLIEGSVRVVGQVLPSMVVAGPWVWAHAVAPRIAGGFGLSVLVAVVGWFVIWRGRRAGLRGWVPLAVLLGLTIGALSAARVAAFGSSVLLNPYYYVPGLGILAITLAVGYLPSGLPVDRSSVEPGRWQWRAAVVVLLISATAAGPGYARAVPSLPGRAYLQSARAALAQPTLNTASPRGVFGVFSYTPPFDTAEHTLSFAGVEGSWINVSDDPFMLDDQGARVPLRVDGVRFELPGSCIAVGEPLALAMPAGREPNWPTYELTYRARTAAVAEVIIGTSTVSIPLEAGQHTVFFVGDGRPESLVIRAEGVCVSGLEMGHAVPAA